MTRGIRAKRYPLPVGSIQYKVNSGAWADESGTLGSNFVDITDLVFYSTVLRRKVSYSVALPVNYDSSGVNYPVVWHFHGQQTYPTGNNNRYLSAIFPERYGTAVQGGHVRHHITVFVNGLNYSMYMDNYDKSVQWETMFITELMPLIHSTYRTLGATKQYNATMGFSMGGFGAVRYALKHDDKFGGCAAYGAPLYDEVYDYAGDSGLHSWAIPTISPDSTFNAVQIAEWSSKIPQAYLLKDHSRLKLRLVYGGSDNLRNTTGNPFKTRMGLAGVPFTTVTDLAGVTHSTSSYWNNADSNNAFAFVETIFAGT